MKVQCVRATIVLLVGLATSAVARGQMYINEIYLDPPDSLDSSNEYIELRGTPNASLANYSLIFLENEDVAAHTGSTGVIDHIFDFNSAVFPADATGNTSAKLGTNGFLTLRQKNNPYSASSTAGNFAPAPGTANLVNTATGYYSTGWGDRSAGTQNSTVGASQGGHTGILENSGFTAFLIRNNGGAAPVLGQDLDLGNNGLDALPSGWSVVDQIGLHSEAGEAQYGRLYATTNFGPEATTSHGPGSTYTGVGYEIEYVGRWGSRNTNTAADWHVSNLTDNAASGFVGPADFRQSGDPHPIGGVFGPNFHLESNQEVPYGTILTNSLGRANYPISDGDLNQDGYVGQSDLSIVLSHWGQTDLSHLGDWLSGDPSGDGYVGQSDLSFVLSGWGAGQLIGQGLSSPDFAGFSTQGMDLSALQSSPWAQAVPEPGSLVLLFIAGLFGFLCWRKRLKGVCIV